MESPISWFILIKIFNQDTFESTYEDYGYSIYDENLSLVKQFPGMNSHY